MTLKRKYAWPLTQEKKPCNNSPINNSPNKKNAFVFTDSQFLL